MVIADTGFWVAIANPSDDDHDAAVQAMKKLTEPLITTWPVITETCYLLLTKIGNHAQVGFIDRLVAKDFQTFKIRVEHAPRISELMKKYADLPMDLADASLIVLAEHLGDGRILSVDRRDFNTYRWKNREPFENLMFPE